MSKTDNSKKRFIVSSVSLNSAVALAERAYAVRDYRRVLAIGESLILNGPPAFRSIGSYYCGLGCFANGEGDANAALLHYGTALSHAPNHYRQRIFLSLATLQYHQQGYERALRAFEQLARLDDPVTVIEARRALAIFDSLEGKHHRAARRLEDLYGMVQGKESLLLIPQAVANSLAVELNAAGRPVEALKVSAALSTCPYRSRFPEWQETQADIQTSLYRSNVVPFPKNVVTPATALREFNSIFEPNLERLQAGDFQALTAVLKGRLR